MKRILVSGVAVLDFIFHVDELPALPEKYRAKAATISGGGCAGNAAVGIARLGGEAILASRVGDDFIGDMITKGLTDEKVNCSLLKRFEDHTSQYSSVLVDAAGERQIVSFRDWDIPDAADWLVDATPRNIDACLADTRWPEAAAALMQLAKDQNVPGIIDAEAPVMVAEDALQLASHVAFSAQGLRDFTGSDDIRTGLELAKQKLPGWICVTDGEHGVLFFEGESLTHLPAFKITAVETLGAGDLWHGAFALRLAKGDNKPEAMRYANAVAALKCQQIGGRDSAPYEHDVTEFLKDQSFDNQI